MKSIIFWVAVIILVVGLTQVFGPIFTPFAENAPKDKVILRTLFHPRVLGALVLMLIIQRVTQVFKN